MRIDFNDTTASTCHLKIGWSINSWKVIIEQKTTIPFINISYEKIGDVRSMTTDDNLTVHCKHQSVLWIINQVLSLSKSWAVSSNTGQVQEALLRQWTHLWNITTVKQATASHCFWQIGLLNLQNISLVGVTKEVVGANEQENPNCLINGAQNPNLPQAGARNPNHW